jgi:hypothetical protein
MLAMQLVVPKSPQWFNTGFEDAMDTWQDAKRQNARRKRKYDGLLPTEMHRLKQLEEENMKLRKVVADLSLDRETCRTSSPESYEAYPGAQAG